jgi:AcrR family transcriptional regulator
MKHVAKADSRAATDRYYAILQAAERLFGEKGYRSVSIEEIAEATGVSKGLVLYHFSSKNALLEHILRDALSTLLIKWDSIAQRSGSGRDKIGAAVRTLFDMLNARPYPWRIAIFQLPFEEDMQDILNHISEESILRIDRLVKDGIAAGEFRPVDSRMAATMLLAICTTLPFQAVLKQQPPRPTREIADEISELFYEGIRK